MDQLPSGKFYLKFSKISDDENCSKYVSSYDYVKAKFWLRSKGRSIKDVGIFDTRLFFSTWQQLKKKLLLTKIWIDFYVLL